MTMTYVLIDYENVQPGSLDVLDQEHYKTLVFVGSGQSKLVFDTVAAVQRLGKRAEYIKISGNGPNALDFHIAYYIGQLSTQDPTARFHIISNDKGFDPLIAHLEEKKVHAIRSKDLSGISVAAGTALKTTPDRFMLIVAQLQRLGTSRPRTVKRLSNTIAAMFKNQCSSEEILGLIEELKQRKIVVIDKTKVAYPIG